MSDWLFLGKSHKNDVVDRPFTSIASQSGKDRAICWKSASNTSDDWGAFDRFAEIAAPATRRLPVLDEVGVCTLINGPTPISPDGEPVLSKAPGLENVFLACGFTSGIAACCGAGRGVAEWILAGEPALDLASLDPRRFVPMNGPELHARAVESHGRYYAISRGEGP